MNEMGLLQILNCAWDGLNEAAWYVGTQKGRGLHCTMCVWMDDA